MAINIARPTVSIIRLPSGKTTYTVTCDHWAVEYGRLRFENEEKDTKKHMKRFEKEFDVLATQIETGLVSPFNIMGSLVQNGLFRSKRKLTFDPIHI